MKRILLTSHGRLASGLKDTLEFFLGQSDMIAAVDAYVDTSSDYLQQLQRFVDSAGVGEAIIFTDIYGGSVNQQVSAMVMESGKDIPIVTGMNLPIVLSAAMTDDCLTAERMESMLKDAADFSLFLLLTDPKTDRIADNLQTPHDSHRRQAVVSVYVYL